MRTALHTVESSDVGWCVDWLDTGVFWWVVV